MNGIQVAQALTQMAHAVEANKDFLCELDSEVGDGDHGVSMTIGMRAARLALAGLKNPTPESAFRSVADAFADEVGAASGVLYELGFAAGAAAAHGKSSLDTSEDWSRIFRAIALAIKSAGRAELGDKTMLDAWLPAADALRESAERSDRAEAGLTSAARAALDGVQRTKDLVPRHGRASLLGDRARGHQDAGATSAYIIIKAIRDYAAARE